MIRLKNIHFCLLITIISLSVSCDLFEEPDTTNSIGTGAELASLSELNIIPTAVPPSSGASLPSFYDLSQNLPPVRNQGNKGSCASWASGYYLKGYHEKIDQNNTFGNNHSGEYSPDFLFNIVKSSNDCTKGSKVTDNLDRLKQVGICNWIDMPYSVNDCASQPSSEALNSAACSKIADYELLYSQYMNTNSNFIIGSKEFIFIGTPIIIVYPVDENMQNYTPLIDGEYIYRIYNSSDHVGYHASLVIGFDDGKNAFKVVNSWGNNWGNNGFFWFDFDLYKDIILEAYITEDLSNPTCSPVNSGPVGILKVVNTSSLIQKFRIKMQTDPNYNPDYEIQMSALTTAYYYNLAIGAYNCQSSYSATFGGGGLRSGQALISENDTTLYEIVF